VADWIGSLDCAEVIARCEAGDVPIGPLNSIADIFADPQFKARDTLVALQHPDIGEVIVPNVIARLSETPGSLDSLGPALGQHNDDVYRELLGMSEEQLATLKQAGTV